MSFVSKRSRSCGSRRVRAESLVRRSCARRSWSKRFSGGAWARGAAEFWSGAFWYDFWEATLENWQSEFLQFAT